jgi:hypothetical protein
MLTASVPVFELPAADSASTFLWKIHLFLNTSKQCKFYAF